LDEAITNADLLVLLVNHSIFNNNLFEKIKLMRTPIIFDAVNALQGFPLMENGISYYKLGGLL
jgi:UDP-N-acetyl-D-mannosaminuronate dehydrogenase